MLTREIVAAYHASRDPRAERSVLCHAPFVSLNFEQNGHVTACCYNRDFVLGTYPQQSVREIWEGAAARALREAFHKQAEAPGCDLCFHQLKSENFFGTLMRNFDRYSNGASYKPELGVAAPLVLEFEISNTCNLECVMCSGNWSSSIRARREKLPPLRSPYDRRFVEQLEEFLPSISAAKFLGGEPFLIERYYQIWESIRRLNPEAQLSITTNATVVPDRARELLEGLRASIVVSLDGITPETYQAIRKNAEFERVMRNLEYFTSYTQRRGTLLSIAVCPMTHNWRELPLLLAFCEERHLQIYFNTVMRPVESALCGLSRRELQEVVAHLEPCRPAGDASWTVRNRERWDGLLSQLGSWLDEKRRFEQSCSELETRLRNFAEGGAAGGAADGHMVPEGFDRIVSTLVLAFRLESEHGTLAHADLGNILPRTPLPAWREEDPSACEILFAVHVLSRFLDAQGGDPMAADPAGLLLERRRLRQSLDWLSASGWGPERVQGLVGWMRARILQAEVSTLLDWTRKLLASLDADWGLAFDFADEMRQRLPAGLQHLRSRGLDERACGKVVEYYGRLLVEKLRRPILPWLASDGRELSDSAGPMPSVRDLDDLSRVMDAIYLFHLCSEPSADHAWLRSRLDSCLSRLATSGRVHAVCRTLEQGHLGHAYGHLVTASDDSIARDIESLA